MPKTKLKMFTFQERTNKHEMNKMAKVLVHGLQMMEFNSYI